MALENCMFQMQENSGSPSSWSHGCILDVQILCAQDILPLNSQYITAWHVHFLDELRCQKLEQLILITTVRGTGVSAVMRILLLSVAPRF